MILWERLENFKFNAPIFSATLQADLKLKHRLKELKITYYLNHYYSLS